MDSHLLSWIIFTPLIGMLAVIAAPRSSRALIQLVALAATLVPLILCTVLYFGAFQSGVGTYQLVERIDWIRAIRAEY
jgi:NADH-quinone oxidoreductase subunit M